MGEFDQLLVNHSAFLKPFAVTLTRDPEEAKDLFQETLTRALVNSDKYNGGTNIRAWLYTIMRNIFINNYRRRAKYRTIHYGVPEELGGFHPVDREQPDSQFQAKQILQEVYRLPEIFRNPFILYFEGFRYQEISAILAEPLGTIKSRIHFARKLLKTETNR